MKLSEVEIINWRKINIYSFWGGLFFTLCHPIISFRNDRHCYGSFPWTVAEFFTRKMWKYMPFSKACRWLGYTLVQRTYNSKYIDWNWANCYDKNLSYHAKCFMGYVHAYSKSTKKEKTIYKGWVFTKKKAMKVLKEVILHNKTIYNPNNDCYPEVYNNYYLARADYMLDILYNGKSKEVEFLDNTFLDKKYKESKDKIVKLWCYVSDLLTCRNDFDAHSYLADICKACDLYIYHQEMKEEPTIDVTYNLTLKRLGQKEADKWKNSQIKQYNKKERTKAIEKKIYELRIFYINQPFEYYRI